MGVVSGGFAAEPSFRQYAVGKGIFKFWQIQDETFAEIGGGYISDEEREKYRLSSQLGRQLRRGTTAEGLMYPTVARD